MPHCNHRRRGRGERPHVAHEKKTPRPQRRFRALRRRALSIIGGLAASRLSWAFTVAPPALPPTCSHWQANRFLGRFPELRASLGCRATASLCSRGDSKAASGQSEQTRMPHTTRLEK